MIRGKVVNLRWTIRVVVLAAMLATAVMVTLLSSPPVYADTHTSTATGGAWGTAGTWDLGVPATTDSVVIATTGTGNVTTAGNQTCAGITINANANLSMANGNVLTVNGDVSGSGIWRGLGAAATISLTGNWSFTGTSSGTANSVTFKDTAAQLVGGFTTTGTISMTKTAGTATFTGNVNGAGLTINGSGGTLDLGANLTHIFTGAWTRTNGTLNGNSSTLKIGGTTTNTGGTFTAGTSTVNYTASTTQTIANVTYNNLTLSGTSAKTTTGATVNGILSMEGTATASAAITYGTSATLKYNTSTARTASTNEWPANFTATGGVIIANTGAITTGGAKVFYLNVPLTINNNATLTPLTNLLTFGGNFINNGTLTSGSGGVTITNTSATQFIDGFTTTGNVLMTKTSGIAILDGNVNGAALTINGSGGTLLLGTILNHTFTSTVTLTAGTLDGGSSTINASRMATGAWTNMAGVFTANTSTVNFGGAGAQSITGTLTTTFNNLTLSNSGLKTLTKVPIVNGILSMEGTATASALPTYASGATLQYNTSTSRNSGPEWITPFAATGGVIITNTGTITLAVAKAFNAYVPLTIQSGATLSTNASNNYSLTFGGNFVNNGGTLSAGSSMMIIAYTATTQSIAGFTTTGLVTNQKTAGTATFTGNVNGGSFTLNSNGGTLDLGQGLTHTFTGSWTRTIGALIGNSSTLIIGGVVTNTAGTFTPGTSTVNYSGTGQNIAPVDYYNLTLSGSGTKNMVNVSNIGGTLTIGNGITLADGGYTLTANGNISNSGTHSGTGQISLSSGSASHTLSGSGTYGNLSLNDSLGALLTGSPTVSGKLTLTSGDITTGANNLIIAAGGSISGGSSSSYVNGYLQKYFNTGSGQSFTFPIGDTGNYTPVAPLASMMVTVAGSLTASTTAGEHPNIDTSDINSSASVNRYWTLTANATFASSTCNATFTFVAGDVDGGADTSSFIVGKYYSSVWTDPTVGTKTSTSTQATGLNSFGDFAIGVAKPDMIEVTAPSPISGWALPTGTNTNSSTLGVTAQPSFKTWTVTASDGDPTTGGHMTQWNGSAYNTSIKLATAMNVSGPAGEVPLPGGGLIATGKGNNASISISFKQFVTWSDDPYDYRIVVTFIGTIN